MKKILEHFRKNDPRLYQYCLKVKLEPIIKDKPENYFSRLCREIIGQQLSDQSSNAILARFNKLFSRKPIKLKDALSLSHQQLRATGMSNSKARYVKNLAQDICNGNLAVTKLDELSDEIVIKELTKVKGIGPWTSEMFLMFVLGRENVFSFGDLGLRKAINKIYGGKKELSQKQMEKIISAWSPYKTYASRVLWATLDLEKTKA